RSGRRGTRRRRPRRARHARDRARPGRPARRRHPARAGGTCRGARPARPGHRARPPAARLDGRARRPPRGRQRSCPARPRGVALMATDPATARGPVEAVIYDLGNVLVGWDPYGAFDGLDRAAVDDWMADVDFAAFNHAQDAGRTWSEAVAHLEATRPHLAAY